MLNSSLDISGKTRALLCASFARHEANYLAFNFQNFCKHCLFQNCLENYGVHLAPSIASVSLIFFCI